jgi:hypothetical protein
MPDDHPLLFPRRDPERIDLAAIKTGLEICFKQIARTCRKLVPFGVWVALSLYVSMACHGRLGDVVLHLGMRLELNDQEATSSSSSRRSRTSPPRTMNTPHRLSGANARSKARNCGILSLIYAIGH